MNSEMTKIFVGNIFRTVLTAIITFFVTKHVIQADVASHLMRGDTVALWNGTINVNMAMVINVMVGLAVPIILPIALGVWSRMVIVYQRIVAASEKFSMTGAQLDQKTKEASTIDIIKTVAAGQPTT